MSNQAHTGQKAWDWYAMCDVCGGRFWGSSMKVRWDNLLVCDDDYEERHPQDFIRLHKEHRLPPVVRPIKFKAATGAEDADPHDITTDNMYGL